MNASTCKSSHHLRPLALFAVCLLATSMAWPAPPATPPATRSVEVSFRDLDLNTPSGAAKLYRRIQAAARNVCQYERTSARAPIIWQYCVPLDPSLAEPHSSLAFIKLFNDWDWSGAEAE